MKPESRQAVETDINSYEWPVPIPIDTTLEHIRVELLNYGAAHVWLDILCLRQMGCTQRHEHLREEKEHLLEEEWKFDVPTIGNVYRSSKMTFRYYNGLGLPLGPANLKDDRHWINRA